MAQARILVYFFGLLLPCLFFPAAPSIAASKPSLNDYYLQRKKNPDRAVQSLQKFIGAQPNHIAARLEMAYYLINKKAYADAVPHLEKVRELDSQNEQATVQLGYAYQALGQNDRAYQLFKNQSSSDNSACQALSDLAPQRWKFFRAPFFSDVYGNALYLSRFNDTLWTGQARAGVLLGTRGHWEFYGSLRMTDDNQSVGGRLPEILSDNVFVYAAGARVHPLASVPISLYAEAGQAKDLNDRNRPSWRGDQRGGVTYFNEWKPPARCAPGIRFPFDRSRSLYADFSLYSRYDNNGIGYVQWREGWRVFEAGRLQLDGTLLAGGSVDTNKDYFNNTAEGGAGVNLKPNLAWPFTFRYTAVKGAYVRGNRGASPRTYTDHRWEAIGYLRF